MCVLAFQWKLFPPLLHVLYKKNGLVSPLGCTTADDDKTCKVFIVTEKFIFFLCQAFYLNLQRKKKLSQRYIIELCVVCRLHVWSLLFYCTSEKNPAMTTQRKRQRDKHQRFILPLWRAAALFALFWKV